MNQALSAFATAATCCVLVMGCSKKSAERAAIDVQPPPASSSALPRTPAPEGARVWITSPADGASVSGPITVTFGAENLAIVPAGDQTPASGHHHLLINTELPNLGVPIPADEQHVHFGKGQTETTLELGPGTYTLQLLAGDYLHIPHEPSVASEVITIVVE